MKPLTELEKEIIVSRLFWDQETKQLNLTELIDNGLKNINRIESQTFFRKLLTSCDWYTILKLIPAEKIQLVLSEPILQHLFPKELQDRYKYARKVLSR